MEEVDIDELAYGGSGAKRAKSGLLGDTQHAILGWGCSVVASEDLKLPMTQNDISPISP